MRCVSSLAVFLLACCAVPACMAAPVIIAEYKFNPDDSPEPSLPEWDEGTYALDLEYASPFDPASAMHLLHSSYAAYCSPASIAANTCKWCTNPDFVYTGRIHDLISDLEGFVGFDPIRREVITTYRGSSSILNWLTDAAATQMQFENTDASVHSGFYKTWLRLRDQVNKLNAAAMKNCGRNCVYVLTGHSLGAAISGFHAIDMGLSGISKDKFYVLNFGMPRIGDEAFADLYAQNVGNTTRMVHQYDLVPHLPPMAMKYHHVAVEVWSRYVKNDTLTYTVCNQSGEDKACSDGVNPLKYNTVDHLHYMGVFEDNCGKSA